MTVDTSPGRIGNGNFKFERSWLQLMYAIQLNPSAQVEELCLSSAMAESRFIVLHLMSHTHFASRRDRILSRVLA